MTRTGKSVKLARHVSEPVLAIHPDDAAELNASEGSYFRVESPYGAATLRAAMDDGLQRGTVFAPFHWNDATSGLARIDAVAQAKIDPVSGQPELKATPVALKPVIMGCEGILLTRSRVTLPGWLQHSRITVPGGEALLFASVHEPLALHALLLNHLGEAPRRAGMLDPDARQFRTVCFAGNRIEAALFVGPHREPATVDWLIEAFANEALDAREIKAVLAGQPPAGGTDLGPLICSCFAVRRAAIEEAVRHGASDVDAVGVALKAGTNCGSCRPEIKRVIHDQHSAACKPAAA
jgi:assimilatory nitrate reductase catalytic subunit